MQSGPACVAWPSFVPKLSSCPVLLPHVPFGPGLLHTVRLCPHCPSPGHAEGTARNKDQPPLRQQSGDWHPKASVQPQGGAAKPRSSGVQLRTPLLSLRLSSDLCRILSQTQIFIGEQGQEPSTEPGACYLCLWNYKAAVHGFLEGQLHVSVTFGDLGLTRLRDLRSHARPACTQRSSLQTSQW